MDENVQKIMENRIDDHEDRLRKLEANVMELKVSLSNIEKNQTETKYLILEQNKEQSKLINKMLDQVGSTIKTENEFKFYEKKEIWALIALVAGYLCKTFLN
jgi:predicted transglutaminase-like cysteine proteinase